MRQVFLDKGAVTVKEVAQPLLNDYSVLVAVHYSFISSGTELATLTNAQAGLFSNVPHKVKKVLKSVALNGVEGTAALIRSKLKGEVSAIGYSCAGQVIAAGKKVRRLSAGDWVACAGAGYANHADLICVPEQLVVRLNKKEYLKAASITTLGAIALQGIRRAKLQLGELVCVFGLGLIGQLSVQLAKVSGCTVVGVDLMPERLALAEQLGADAVYHATEDDLQQEINMLTEHHGVDATLITAASKSSSIIQQTMEITRKKGRVIIVGDVGLDVEREFFYKKEIDLRMSCSYGPGRYDPLYEQRGQDYPYAYVRWTENRNMQAFVRLIEKGALNIEALISAEAELEDIDNAYKRIQGKQVLGVVVKYSHNHHKPPFHNELVSKSKTQKTEVRFVPAIKDKVRVGIIGAGGFAKIKLMPIVSRIKHAKINAIVDTDIANSLSVSRLYGAAKAYTCDDDLFTNDDVDAVVIASPHKYHCDQALKAMQYGKAVFVEKPMVTDFDQLARFKAFFEKHKTLPFCVDYNRSFAPFIQKIKRLVSKRRAPLAIQYRMNAGLIPKEHWIQTDVGAGRIIGEACHIFDLFCYLTDARPTSVSVEALHAFRDDLFPTDNFCAQIRFDDGSLCSLLYTAIGHSDLGKERMEVFFDGKSVVLDDYIRLFGFGVPSWFNETVSSQDKGHETLIRQFFGYLKQETFELPIDMQRLLLVAELTLIIDQLACEGGGAKGLSL